MDSTMGVISKIQRYSTKDGPGLRSTVFMMGCNLRCAWCANPELIGKEPKVLYYREKCQKCGRCVSVANDGSIVLSDKGCIIDQVKCTNIMECASNCYFDAYEVIGQSISQDELFDKLYRDKEFYWKSGGGVTFSGGEAGLQHEFVTGVTKRLREKKIHVALDTAGNVPWERLQVIVRNVDTVLYDIKAFDSEIHKQCTAVGNQLIMENAKKIADMGIKMYIRMVIVPRMNDDWDDICKRLEFVKNLGTSVEQVDILKYHKLGIGKYVRMGIPYTLDDIPDCDYEYIQKIYNRAVNLGLNVSIDG